MISPRAQMFYVDGGVPCHHVLATVPYPWQTPRVWASCVLAPTPPFIFAQLILVLALLPTPRTYTFKFTCGSWQGHEASEATSINIHMTIGILRTSFCMHLVSLAVTNFPPYSNIILCIEHRTSAKPSLSKWPERYQEWPRYPPSLNCTKLTDKCVNC